MNKPDGRKETRRCWATESPNWEEAIILLRQIEKIIWRYARLSVTIDHHERP